MTADPPSNEQKSARRWLNLGRIAQRRPPPVGTTPSIEVHKENKWRLLRYARGSHPVRYRTPVLLVPSLINRHYVLDLMPGKSFAEFLVAQGHDVFIIDWGTPTDEDRYLTFDDFAGRYIARALRHACKAAGQEQAHLLGYCLGGTLTTIHAAVHPERIRSLTLLAAPIDFHDEGMLSLWTRTQSFDLGALVRAFGNVPWQLMQASFLMMKPTLTPAKWMGFVDRAWDDEFLDGFFAIETWGNDNVSFPGGCYERYIQELYRDNALLQGTFVLDGKPAKLEQIRCPTMVVTFEDDHIVPFKSASAAHERIGADDKQMLRLRGGHVGAVVSKKGKATLWPKLAAFWAARDR